MREKQVSSEWLQHLTSLVPTFDVHQALVSLEVEQDVNLYIDLWVPIGFNESSKSRHS